MRLHDLAIGLICCVAVACVPEGAVASSTTSQGMAILWSASPQVEKRTPQERPP